MTAPRLPAALLALTPGDLEPSSCEAFAHRASRATSAGLEALLVREPDLSDRATLDLARLLRRVLPASTWIGVHDRAYLAAAAALDGVHLGFRSLVPREARAILPPSVVVGFSAHEGDAADADAARRGAADYLLFGPVLETASKRGWKDPVGFDGLRAACAATATPIWGIGGMRPEHFARACECGARGIAVRGGIFGAADPAAACERYVDALRSSGRPVR